MAFSFRKILIVLLILLVVAVDCRRGGGSRSGSRSSSRSRSSRSRSRSSSTSTYRGGRYGGMQWQAAAAAGYIYGYTSYSRRRMYSSSPHSEPRICRNVYDYVMGNGTTWLYFICPKEADPNDHMYCCGPKDRQKCCGYWDDPGRVAGGIFGVLFFIGICALVVFCCIRWRRRKREQAEQGIVLQTGVNQTKATDGGAGPYQLANTVPPPEATTPVPPPGVAYPPQPGVPPPGVAYPPQPGVPPPGAYPPQPYPPQPGMEGYPPQPGMMPPGGMYPPPGPGMPPPGMPMPDQGGMPPPMPSPGYRWLN